MAGARPSACAAAVDHNVLIVGYDSDAETNVDYWIVKGNFGEEWGEGGYARVKMSTRGLCGTGCLAAFPLTVVPRTFGIDPQGKPVYDGSAPSFISAYNAEAAAAADGSDAVAPVDPTTILPAPLPNQRTNAGAGTGPTTTTTPGAGSAAPAPVTAPEGAKANASAAEEEAARKRRNRIVGGAVGGAFLGVFALLAAFVAVKTLQQRRAEMSEVPERPHLDVL